MSDVLVLGAFVSFVLFLTLRKQRKYAAVAGWSCMVLNLITDVPAFLSEDNILYPAMALLSLPFLAVTVQRLLKDDPVILQLSRTAAVATLIYVPFALVPILRDALITTVVGQAFLLITALGHHPQLLAWDILYENGFANQIIPGCTGLTAVAILLGIALGVEKLSLRQVLAAVFLVVPTIGVLNLLRVSVVFIAVSDAWFASFPDPRPAAASGADFFWAHNIFAEAIAVVVLLAMVAGLCRIIPGLAVFARELVGVYRDSLLGLMNAVRNSFRS
jgi:archaeosortase A (PGF-CTERM-specific)